MNMNHAARVVRYAELNPCKTAFIDAHTPGSNQKENFTIIGGGVSEGTDQFIHISETPGFNVGAAGQPPKCTNSLHTHRTAEVFFVLTGRWRFFWGHDGTAGEVILERGDIFNIPTPVFRGFENIGQDYGMIMAILGGDDAGGGVVWTPEVVEQAAEHGLILGDDGLLYDRKKNEDLPSGVLPVSTLCTAKLEAFPDIPASAIVPRFVKRHLDLIALSAEGPVEVIGDGALIQDRPGFAVNFVSHRTPVQANMTTKPTVLMPVAGHWALDLPDETLWLNPGDTALIEADTRYNLAPSMAGEASLYLIVPTEDPAGPTQGFDDYLNDGEKPQRPQK